jgi:hypothetical protein
MRAILVQDPSVCPALLPNDVRLFTSCNACSLSNKNGFQRPNRSTIRATAFAYRLHADTSGVIRPSTSSGFKRALFVVDDASRWVWVALLPSADMLSVSRALRQIFQEASSGESVLKTKILRSDNGTEFKNKLVNALLAQASITRELTCVSSSHQNGVAERAIGVLFRKVRTLLVDSSLPPRFWGEALIASTHIRNRMPCSANPNNASPYEVRHGHRPSLSHLRTWGTTAYVPAQDYLTKVMPRNLRGIFLGYGHTVSRQRGWRVYVPSLRKVITAPKVTFASDLPTAVSKRDPSLVSSDNISLTNRDNRAVTAADNDASRDLPVSLRFNQPTYTPPVTRSASAPAPVTPPQPSSSSPVPAPATSTTLRPASPPPVINTTAEPHQELDAPPDATNTARETSRRPRGRPPRNSRWDPNLGRYVPVLHCGSLPTQGAIYALVTRRLLHDDDAPASFKAAVNGPDSRHWKLAIAAELASLRKHGTWKVIKRSAMSREGKPIRMKWVFKIKRDTFGNIARYKARLVVCGYAQKYGRDYDETFAPVASAASIRLVFALAAINGYTLTQHDVATAFLYGVLPTSQQVYLRCPQGVNIPADCVLQAQRGIYGLRQSPRLFNEHLRSAFLKLGYNQSLSDPCLFFKGKGSTFSILAVVVDDILHAAATPAIAKNFAAELAKTYTVTNLGTPRHMIGLKVTVSPSSIALTQQHYVESLLAKFEQDNAAPCLSPASTSGCLAQSTPGDSPLLDPTTHPYLSLVGSLLWATLTRPDVATAVSRACQHTREPTLAHWRAALRILRYLGSTKSLGLLYLVKPRPVTITAYVDAAFGNETKRRSRYGCAVYLSGCLISWTTKPTTMVCLSTAEAEFVAATCAARDVVWLTNAVTELTLPPASPAIIYEDNQACIAMIKNHVVSGRNRHFCIKMAWLREQVAQGNIVFKFVPSKFNVADIFTKILADEAFADLRDTLLAPLSSHKHQRTTMGVPPRGGC